MAGKNIKMPLPTAIKPSAVFLSPFHVNGLIAKEWTKNSAKMINTGLLGIDKDLMSHKALDSFLLQNEIPLRFYFLWPGIK